MQYKYHVQNVLFKQYRTKGRNVLNINMAAANHESYSIQQHDLECDIAFIQQFYEKAKKLIESKRRFGNTMWPNVVFSFG